MAPRGSGYIVNLCDPGIYGEIGKVVKNLSKWRSGIYDICIQSAVSRYHHESRQCTPFRMKQCQQLLSTANHDD